MWIFFLSVFGNKLMNQPTDHELLDPLSGTPHFSWSNCISSVVGDWINLVELELLLIYSIDLFLQSMIYSQMDLQFSPSVVF